MKRVDWRWVAAAEAVVVMLLFVFIASAFSGADAGKSASAAPTPPLDSAKKAGSREMAYLLVKLVKKTRSVMAGHYTRSQSSMPGVNVLYQRSLAKNLILPAAVADQVFSEVVPHATGGRAWVKRVVPEPRHPHTRGDDTALALLKLIQDGAPSVERRTGGAYYYAEPIVAKKSCLPCHGSPKGAPDRVFPEYKKDGWKPGEIVGAVVARAQGK